MKSLQIEGIARLFNTKHEFYCNYYIQSKFLYLVLAYDDDLTIILTNHDPKVMLEIDGNKYKISWETIKNKQQVDTINNFFTEPLNLASNRYYGFKFRLYEQVDYD